MASSILSSLTSKVSFSILNEMQQTYAVPNLKIVEVRIRYSSNNMRHRMEDGSYLVDSRIIVPMTIDITAICPDLDTQNQLTTLFADRSNSYTVTSKGLVFKHVMVDQEGLEQTPEMMSATPIKLSFKQVLAQGTDPVLAAQPADSSSVDQGYISLASTAQTATGLFSAAYQSAAAGLVA
jgi:hypothetical protein